MASIPDRSKNIYLWKAKTIAGTEVVDGHEKVRCSYEYLVGAERKNDSFETNINIQSNLNEIVATILSKYRTYINSVADIINSEKRKVEVDERKLSISFELDETGILKLEDILLDDKERSKFFKYESKLQKVIIKQEPNIYTALCVSQFEITQWQEDVEEVPSSLALFTPTETGIRSLVRRSIAHDIQTFKLKHNATQKKIFGYTAEEQEQFCSMFEPYSNTLNSGGCVLLRVAGPTIKTRLYDVNGCKLTDPSSAKRRRIQLEVPSTKDEPRISLFGGSSFGLAEYEVIAGSLYQPESENLLADILDVMQFMLPVQYYPNPQQHAASLQFPWSKNTNRVMNSILSPDDATKLCNHDSVSSAIADIQHKIDLATSSETFDTDTGAYAAQKQTNANQKKEEVKNTWNGLNPARNVSEFYVGQNPWFRENFNYPMMSSLLEELHAKDPILFFFGVPNSVKDRFLSLQKESLKAAKNATTYRTSDCNETDPLKASFMLPGFREYNQRWATRQKVTQEEIFRKSEPPKISIILPELVYLRPKKQSSQPIKIDRFEERWAFGEHCDRLVGIVTLSMWKRALETRPFCEEIPVRLNRLNQLGFDQRRGINRVSQVRFDAFPEEELSFIGLNQSSLTQEDPDEYDKIVRAYEVDREKVDKRALLQEFSKTIRLIFEALLVNTKKPEHCGVSVDLRSLLGGHPRNWTQKVAFYPSYYLPNANQYEYYESKSPLIKLLPIQHLDELPKVKINGNHNDTAMACQLQFEYSAKEAQIGRTQLGDIEDRFAKILEKDCPFGEIADKETRKLVTSCMDFISTKLELTKLSEQKNPLGIRIDLHQASNLLQGQSEITDDFGMPFEPGIIHFNLPHIRNTNQGERKLVYCIGSEPNMVGQSLILLVKLLQLFDSKCDANPVKDELSVAAQRLRVTPFPTDKDDFTEKIKTDDLEPPTNVFSIERETKEWIVDTHDFCDQVGCGSINLANDYVLADNVSTSVFHDATPPGFYPPKDDHETSEINLSFPAKQKTGGNKKNRFIMPEDETEQREKSERHLAYSDQLFHLLKDLLEKKKVPFTGDDMSRLEIPVVFSSTEARDINDDKPDGYLCLTKVKIEAKGQAAKETTFTISGTIRGLRVLACNSRCITTTTETGGYQIETGIHAVVGKQRNENKNGPELLKFEIDSDRFETLQYAHDRARANVASNRQDIALRANKCNYSVQVTKLCLALTDGFEGFHFSNLKAYQRTVSAIAMGENRMKLIRWATTIAILDEPRAIDLNSINYSEPTEGDGLESGRVDNYSELSLSVRQLNWKDAKLMTLIRNGDRAQQFRVFGGATGAVSYGDRFASTLVTPAIVLVRGPGPTALTTPCRIASFCCKTAVYRLVETQVVEKLYTRTRQVRSRPASVRDDCLYDHLRRRQLRTTRELINIRPQIIEPLAKLFLECHNQNRTTERTSQAYSRQALVMQEAAIANLVEQVLFHA